MRLQLCLKPSEWLSHSWRESRSRVPPHHYLHAQTSVEQQKDVMVSGSEKVKLLVLTKLLMPSFLKYNLHGNRSCELGSYALDDTVADKDKVQSQRAQNHARGTCYFPNICRHTPQETSAPTGAFSAQMTSASLGTPARSLWKWHWNSANVWEGGFLVNLSWFNGPALRIFCYLYSNDLSRVVSYQTFGCLVRWTESLERVSHQNKRMHDQKFKFIFLHVLF